MHSHEKIQRALQRPTTFPASFDYQILEYLLSGELLTICSVAKAWYQNAIAVFWNRTLKMKPTQTQVELEKDKSSHEIALSRALISSIACQNSYSISRIDRLLKEGAELTTSYPGTLRYYRTDTAERKTIEFKDTNPLEVATCLVEEKGPYGAAVVKHVMKKTLNSRRAWEQLENRREQIVPYWSPHIAAFVQEQKEQHEEKLRQEEEDDMVSYVMSTMEEILVGTCIGLAVLAIPAVIACSILAPPLTALIIICPFWYLSFMLCYCCSGMQVFRFVPLVSSTILAGIAIAATMLTSLVGPIICSAIAIGLGVLVGLYEGVEYLKYRNEVRQERESRETPQVREERQKREPVIKHFQTLAQSAKCQIEPKSIDTFYGGLLNTMSIWQQKMSNININAEEGTTVSVFKNAPLRASRGCVVS